MHHLQRRRRQSAEPCECLRPVIRIFGIITAFVVCGVGVDVYLHGYEAGLYILISSVVILLLEVKWVITLFLHLFCGNENGSCCLQCWSCVGLLGGWRLSLPYVATGVALILWPHNLWLSYVAGLFLIVLAVLRLCTLLRFSNNSKSEGLLPHCDFEKVDSCPDIPEDGFAEVCPNLEDEEPIDDVC